MTTTVYVELDALMDTRLGTVSRIDGIGSVGLVTGESYYMRTRDVFPDIDMDAYRTAWASRDVETLKHSMITHVPLLLKELITKLEQAEEESPFADQLALEVNVWPYELTEQENDLMQLAVMSYAGIQTTPQIVSISPQELTPEKVKRTYSGLIMYNFRDWLQHHMEEFQKWPCPRVTCLAPALYHGEEVEVDKLIQDDMRRDLSPFEMTEMACAEFLGVSLLDVRYFSIFRSKYLPKKPA